MKSSRKFIIFTIYHTKHALLGPNKRFGCILCRQNVYFDHMGISKKMSKFQFLTIFDHFSNFEVVQLQNSKKKVNANLHWKIIDFGTQYGANMEPTWS